MATCSALFEYMDDGEVFTSSAALLDKRWIILPAASLILYFNTERKIQVPEELINLEPSQFFETNFLNVKSNCIWIMTDETDAKQLKIQNAKYVGIFSCKNISESVNFPLACGDTFDEYTFDTFLSLFIVLDLRVDLVFNLKHLHESIKRYLELAKSLKISRGSPIFIDSVPFGSKELFGSYSKGIISNAVGKNNCFILTDAATAPGAEGAPIFLAKSSSNCAAGIVISSVNSWRGEHTGLTLGTLLQPLLSQLLPKTWRFTDFVFSEKDAFRKLIDQSLVQVYCGDSWGSGILIDKKNGIFITNSHVVNSDTNYPIKLKWYEELFPGTVVFRTKEPEIFDIAVIKCLPRYTENMKQVRIANSPAVKGENVFAAGYPLFKSELIFPIVTKGIISLVNNSILHTTCVILPGASGGAIIRTNGELLAMIVCHTSMVNNNDCIIYPRINMAIPISVIRKPLLDFVRTKNVSALERLQTKNNDELKTWQVLQGKL